jgi:hypothetical protein
METGIDSMLARQNRASLRVFHEHHGADGRDRPAKHAIKRPIGCINISSPVVRIHNNRGASLWPKIIPGRLAGLRGIVERFRDAI